MSVFIWGDEEPSINHETYNDKRPLFLATAVWNSTEEGIHEVWFSQHDRSLWDGELAPDEPLEFSLEVRAKTIEEAREWFWEYIVPQTDFGDNEWDYITITKVDE